MTDDDATEETAGAATTGANLVRSKKGVARIGLASIDGQAQRIWNVARRTEVAEVAIARAVTGKPDASASGGRWTQRIATLRLYGIVTKTREGHFKLTELGIALANVGDEPGHLAALGAAVMGVPANALLLNRYDGGELPSLDTLATEFEFGYSMSNADAKAAAQVLVDSAKYAQLVDDSGHVNLGGAAALVVDDPDEDEDDGARGDLDGDAADSEAADDVATEANLSDHEPRVTARKPPKLPPAPPVLTSGSSPAALTVKLDMSGWAIDDVLRVLAALGYESESREPRA